jgi:hypothetical protein
LLLLRTHSHSQAKLQQLKDDVASHSKRIEAINALITSLFEE